MKNNINHIIPTEKDIKAAQKISKLINRKFLNAQSTRDAAERGTIKGLE